ncbi:hypothetical protein FQA39_LY00517 [Lamprigera yunnana]|nr:hypothetical protein FQA39_LY00517 [Lamprigera yunnana]
MKLTEAIIKTLSPQQLPEAKAALTNSKKKRRRVKRSVCEVLTFAEVQERLKEKVESAPTAVGNSDPHKPVAPTEARNSDPQKPVDSEINAQPRSEEDS